MLKKREEAQEKRKEVATVATVYVWVCSCCCCCLYFAVDLTIQWKVYFLLLFYISPFYQWVVFTFSFYWSNSQGLKLHLIFLLWALCQADQVYSLTSTRDKRELPKAANLKLKLFHVSKVNLCVCVFVQTSNIFISNILSPSFVTTDLPWLSKSETRHLKHLF